jgi:hypothetical protein
LEPVIIGVIERNYVKSISQKNLSTPNVSFEHPVAPRREDKRDCVITRLIVAEVFNSLKFTTVDNCSHFAAPL